MPDLLVGPMVRYVSASEATVWMETDGPCEVAILGDVHQAYLHEVAFQPSAGVRSAVYQAVCSPFRNPLTRRERAHARRPPLAEATADRVRA